MTQPTNTFDSFEAIGNREDLSNIIYDISPTDTPVISSIGKNSATATLHEWQTDSLDTAAANAAIEGDDAVGEAITPTVRLTNRTQISDKVIVISGTQDAVDSAGRSTEHAYQLARKAKEIKRDMEFILTNNQAPVTGNSTTATLLRPINSWYSTNTSRGSGGSSGSTTTAATDGTQRAFTEALLKTVIQSTFDAGGEPDMLVVGPFNKQTVSTFTGNATRQVEAETKTLFAGVNVYMSDFGEFKIVPDRFSRDRDAHLLQNDMWAISSLRPFFENPLSRTGDSTRTQLLVEWTLEARNEAGSGIIADLTTS